MQKVVCAKDNKHLRDSCTQALSPLRTPVACSQGVPQPPSDCVLVDSMRDVDVLAPVNTALHIVPDILLQLAE